MGSDVRRLLKLAKADRPSHPTPRKQTAMSARDAPARSAAAETTPSQDTSHPSKRLKTEDLSSNQGDSSKESEVEVPESKQVPTTNMDDEFAAFQAAIQPDLVEADKAATTPTQPTKDSEDENLRPRDRQVDLREEQEDLRRRVRNLEARKRGQKTTPEHVVSMTSGLVDEDEIQGLSKEKLQSVITGGYEGQAKPPRKRVFEDVEDELGFRESSSEEEEED